VPGRHCLHSVCSLQCMTQCVNGAEEMSSEIRLVVLVVLVVLLSLVGSWCVCVFCCPLLTLVHCGSDRNEVSCRNLKSTSIQIFSLEPRNSKLIVIFLYSDFYQL